MKNNPMSLAVICENKKEREHALEVAQQSGIAFGEWHMETDRGNILRVFGDGDWCFLDWNGRAQTILTYADFIAQYGNTEQPKEATMKQNKMDIAVVCENKEQREHALELAKSAGIAFGEWFSQVDRGNILRVYPDGDWIFFNYNGSAKTIFTYADFIAQYGSEPDTEKPPIGLRPRYIAELDRIKEIYAAISRYLDAEKKIPQAWLDELQELNSRQ